MFNPPLVPLGLFELSLTPHLSLLEVPSVGKFSPSNCAPISFCFIIRFGSVHYLNQLFMWNNWHLEWFLTKQRRVSETSRTSHPPLAPPGQKLSPCGSPTPAGSSRSLSGQTMVDPVRRSSSWLSPSPPPAWSTPRSQRWPPSPAWPGARGLS